MWKRSHGRTSEAPPDERGGYRYVRPTATASHLDSTLCSRWLMTRRMGEDAPHRPLPRTHWGASGGKRTAIHSEGGCYSMTSSARARIDGGTVRPSVLAGL